MESETLLLATTIIFASTTFIAPLVIAIRSAKDRRELIEKYESQVDAEFQEKAKAVNDLIECEKQKEVMKKSYEEAIADLSKYKPKRGKGGRFVIKK